MGLAGRKRKDIVLSLVELVGKYSQISFFFLKHVRVCVSVHAHMCAMLCVWR